MRDPVVDNRPIFDQPWQNWGWFRKSWTCHQCKNVALFWMQLKLTSIQHTVSNNKQMDSKVDVDVEIQKKIDTISISVSRLAAASLPVRVKKMLEKSLLGSQTLSAQATGSTLTVIPVLTSARAITCCDTHTKFCFTRSKHKVWTAQKSGFHLRYIDETVLRKVLPACDCAIYW